MRFSIRQSWALKANCSRALALALAVTLAVVVGGTRAASAATAVPAAFDSLSSPVDSSFVRALPVVKQTVGFQETNFASVFPGWQPGVCLLIGFRTDVESKRYVHLVEVTTLDPVEKDTHGQKVALPVSKRSFTFGRTNHVHRQPRVHTFTSLKYPVRVRLFNAEGRLLEEGLDHLPWSFLTNGLVDICDALRNRAFRENPASTSRAPGTNSPVHAGTTLDLSTELESRIARGNLALGGLFAVIGRSSALGPVRDNAIAVVRPPSLWRAVMDMKLNLNLDPRFGQAVELPPRQDRPFERQLGFPLFLQQGQRTLTTVDFVAGSTEGPYFLTSGVRAFRATHPTKPGRRLLAQVLAAGLVNAR
jgi:hypothetical protein